MILRDPVHGLIAFEGAKVGPDARAARLVLRLLDTREVQRLRRIRALGLASLAFPGGDHSRFAHAVGSAHVMQRYLVRVRELEAELPRADRVEGSMRGIAMAAALLHDLGHGPYSHTFEALAPSSPRHEEWTAALILDPQGSIYPILREFDSEAPEEVVRLIRGEGSIPHLAKAVSGTFDVDRIDYLMRDSYMTGVRYGQLDLDWLLASLRLVPGPGPGPEPRARLAVDGEKGLTAVEGFFLARLYMYRQVYLHKAVRAAEVMMRSLFRRLRELDAPVGTPVGMAKILRGEQASLEDYFALDDPALEVALSRWANGGAVDPIVSRLAGALRDRRLFKSVPLAAAPSPEIQTSLEEVVRKGGFEPSYDLAVDLVEVRAYEGETDLSVVEPARGARRLVEASAVLAALAATPVQLRRVIVPSELRKAVAGLLAERSEGSRHLGAQR